MKVFLECKETGERYPADQARWQSDSGGLLDIAWEPRFDRDALLHRPNTLWRYREAIPLDDDRNIVTAGEGCTPLLPLLIDGKRIFVKQDHLFPTGSFKDRGAAVLISKAKELGVKRVILDSSGNAGCAVAAYAAMAGIACEVYVPASTSPAKLTQIRVTGATLVQVPGTREDTAHAALERAAKVYYASHYWNPFFLHGTKTFAFEVCEQLSWRAPGTCILPVGNGTLLLGAALGFGELLRAGVIQEMPVLIGVQSAACSPLARALAEGKAVLSPSAGSHTIAEGIAIAEPIRWKSILESVRTSGGTFVTVVDAEVKSALLEMCGKGFYIEPTAAATIAGVKKYVSSGEIREPVVTAFTGHGLKASEKLMEIFTSQRAPSAQ
jgi:threonine synthase